MINPTVASLPSKGNLRKRLDLSGGDDYDGDDDGGGGGGGGARTVFKMHKTAKKRVNPFKAAPAAAQQAKRVSLPRLSSPPSRPTSSSLSPTPTSTAVPTTGANPNSKDDDAGAHAGKDEDIDDYLSMTLPTTSGRRQEYESSAARRLRKLREAEARARVPSKEELAAQEKQLREEGLSKSLLEDKSSRGYRLMKAMGWRGDGAPLGPPRAADKDKGGSSQEQVRGGEEEEGKGREEGEGEWNKERGEESGHGHGHGGGGPRPGGPILEPIALTIKEDRAGIGHLTEQQRKFRDSLARNNGITTTTTDTATQAQPMTAESYRERIRLERLEKKAEAQFYAAQAVLEAFDLTTTTTTTDNTTTTLPPDPPYPAKAAPATNIPVPNPLKSVPLLYRSLIKHREDKVKLHQARLRHHHALYSSSSLSAHHHNHRRCVHDSDDDDEGDNIDINAYAYTDIDPNTNPGPNPGPGPGAGVGAIDDDNDDGACTDEELDAFNQLPFTRRLDMIVHELREKWTYCFWCKHRYASADEMDESCPGVEEDLHG